MFAPALLHLRVRDLEIVHQVSACAHVVRGWSADRRTGTLEKKHNKAGTTSYRKKLVHATDPTFLFLLLHILEPFNSLSHKELADPF